MLDRFSFFGKIVFKLYYPFNRVKCVKMYGFKAGKNLHIYGKVNIGTEPWLISVGDNVYITDGVNFITHDGGTLLFRNEIPDLEVSKPIKVGDNVYIGNNVIVLPGISIGDNVVVGAGAVITKDIPSNSVAAGVPARVIKPISVYKDKLKKESLHLGHLKGREKNEALKRYYKA